jgi:hypothetical protein
VASTTNPQAHGQWAEQQRVWQEKEDEKVVKHGSNGRDRAEHGARGRKAQSDQSERRDHSEMIGSDRADAGFPFSEIAASALVSGSVAWGVTAVALSILAASEGKDRIRPINASSHWIHDTTPGAVPGIDAQHTVPGALTNHAACLLWAALFESIRSNQSGMTDIVSKACLTSAVAATVDYGLVPKRFTPAWEQALRPTSVSAGFAAMAAGLALGGLLSSSITRGR